MAHAKQVRLIWSGLLALFSLLVGCSQTTTPTGAPPAKQPPVQQAVKKEFDAESGPHSAGKKVMVANNCFRCHTVDSARGPFDASVGKRVSGPELGITGFDPKRTVEWFMAFVRKGSDRMPSYEGKINEQDLRALAEYLTSLKELTGPM